MSKPHDFESFLDAERVVSAAQAEPLTGLKSQTLRTLRCRGGGPPYIKASANRVYYRVRDLLAWRDARVFTSTAEEHAKGPTPAA